MEFIESIQQSVTSWFLQRGLVLLLIVLVTFLVYRFAKIFIEKIIKRALRSKGLSSSAKEKRANTLIGIVSNGFNGLVIIVAGMILLSEMGLDIGPLLAAAGVAGVAIGFGAQYIIRDLLTGFFVIIENQYRIGDVVCIGDTCGLVEDVTPRITVLRDLDGTAHHIPNGEITKASNLTKTYSNVNINITVTYASDIEKVIKVINKVGEELASDPDWKDVITEPIAFLRVNDFNDSGMEIKILGKTEPLKQWSVAGEFRKRIKIAFDKEKIEIALPHRVIYTKPKR